MVRVSIRGIYATALTERLRGPVDVVSPSSTIEARFDGTFDDGPADVAVRDAPDRRGVGASGEPGAVRTAAEAVSAVAIDALAWPDPAPLGATFDAAVTETLGSGAVLELGPREGFLPYDATDGYVEEGDRLRVQVREPAPPWVDRRPAVGAGLEARAGPVTLVRGADDHRADVDDPDVATELVRSVEALATDVPDGWAVRFERSASGARLDGLDAALSLAAERAAALVDGDGPALATWWTWFGRESRFALDRARRRVAPTMAGHHRIKAGADRAGPAVDLVEALCESPGAEGFPFGVVADAFGPRVGDRLALSHGKPDGRRFALGVGEVTAREGNTVVLRREMTAGGAYDGLGVAREVGDVAVTRLTEGRWWYPTVYRDAEGAVKGTYVNVCTPLEVFPEAATYLDLEVDVVRHADGTVERLDDEELDAAVAAGDLPAELADRARKVAASVRRGLAEEASDGS